MARVWSATCSIRPQPSARVAEDASHGDAPFPLRAQPGRLLAMLTVDPVRDTPGVLTAFTQGFVARGHALRVDDTDQLERVVQAFGATTVADHGHAGNTTEVGHTDHTYLVDARGDVVVTGTADMTASDITNDLRTLLTRLDD
jgi:cytochrome oxidase Cu insertion factor (SCO1/SenC/PrrC family)